MQAAISVTESEEFEPKTVKDARAKLSSLTTRFRKADMKSRIGIFFDTDDIVRFYTGLPSMEILMLVFEHIVIHVIQQIQSLSRFQEFIIVPMKLRLNAPL